MAEKIQHYRPNGHFEEIRETHTDGSKTITISEVHDTPLGRSGSTIVRETLIDPNGNSYTKTR